MADFPHSKKEYGFQDNGYKLWVHPIPQQHWRNKNPNAFKYYADEILSIDNLIKDNDLDNPVALSNHPEIWSPTGNEEDINPAEFKYDSNKNINPSEIINATRLLNGTTRINDGRHRIRALKNAGYTHVKIPVHHAIFDSDYEDGLREDYYNNVDPKVLRKIAKSIPYISQRSPEINKVLQRMFLDRANSIKK